MEPWIAIALFAVFAVGIGFGVWMGRGKDESAKERVVELEKELEVAEQRHQDYRDQVVDHFSTTANLFDKLTEDYSAVYKHLAGSSQALCGDQVAKLKADMPEKGLLESESVAERSTPAPEERPADGATEQAAADTEATAKEEIKEEETKAETTAETADTTAEAAAANEAAKTEAAARTIH